MIFGYRVNDVDKAWEELSTRGIIPLYTSEEETANAIWLAQPLSDSDLATLTCIESFFAIQNEEIDWTDQWTQGGQELVGGCLQITAVGHTVLLKPGPGFGDTSHPTTRLMLQLMAPLVHEKNVLDIGSGSGILSIFAAKLGARHVHGVEIDAQAIKHAEENAFINEVKAIFSLPQDYEDIPEIILLNMISSEQKIAYESLPHLHSLHATWIVSGIPIEEKQTYLAITAARNWQLIGIAEEDGWLAMHFFHS